MKTVSKCVTALLLVAAMSGCATTRNNPVDPFEGFNRAVFNFNDGLDRVALKPAAIAYKNILPSFAQTGIGNFFGNLADVWTAVNNLLQGKVESGLNDFMRVAVNSTLGLGGLLDISSEAGLKSIKKILVKHSAFGVLSLDHMWCCRCLDPLRCAMRWLPRSILLAIR